MPKEKPTTEKKPRAPKTVSPEIAQAKQECLEMRAEVETKCREKMKEARASARVRKLTEGLSDEQKAALKASL